MGSSGTSTPEPKSVDTVINEFEFGPFQLVIILLCGLVQASDLMEIQFVNLISQKLQCIWWIDDYWKMFVTSGTFLGLFLGSYTWGPLGDRHCRRDMVVMCMTCIAFYGFLTALAPTIAWVVALRFLVGFGIGGAQPLSATMLSEFMPTRNRGQAWYLLNFLFSLGGVVEIGLAWLVLDLTEGWRYLSAITAAPMLVLSLVWTLWVPPSPRQSLLLGNVDDARRTLDRMADANSSARFQGELDQRDLQRGVSGGKAGLANVLELLRPSTYLRRTLLLAGMMFTSGFSYYGSVLLNIQVPLLMRSRCLPALPVNATTASSSSSSSSKLLVHGPTDPERVCHSCAKFNYLEMLIPSTADLATALINAFVLERLLKRRVVMIASFSLGAVTAPLLSICAPSAARTALMFAARCFISCGFMVVTLYVMEVYPTSVRATATGFHSSFIRVASVLTPAVAQVFVSRVSLLGGLLIFTGLLAMSAAGAFLLPTETKGRPLAQTDAEELGETVALKGRERPEGDRGSKSVASDGAASAYGSVNSPTGTKTN